MFQVKPLILLLICVTFASTGQARRAVLPEAPAALPSHDRLLVADWLAECLKRRPEGWCLDIISELQNDEQCRQNFVRSSDQACSGLGVSSCALKTAEVLPKNSSCAQLVELGSF